MKKTKNTKRESATNKQEPTAYLKTNSSASINLTDFCYTFVTLLLILLMYQFVCYRKGYAKCMYLSVQCTEYGSLAITAAFAFEFVFHTGSSALMQAPKRLVDKTVISDFVFFCIQEDLARAKRAEAALTRTSHSRRTPSPLLLTLFLRSIYFRQKPSSRVIGPVSLEGFRRPMPNFHLFTGCQGISSTAKICKRQWFIVTKCNSYCDSSSELLTRIQGLLEAARNTQQLYNPKRLEFGFQRTGLDDFKLFLSKSLAKARIAAPYISIISVYDHDRTKLAKATFRVCMEDTKKVTPKLWHHGVESALLQSELLFVELLLTDRKSLPFEASVSLSFPSQFKYLIIVQEKQKKRKGKERKQKILKTLNAISGHS
uniref:Uncharacterized protein n=1 Tax=Glossina austeni TaxID=7395 RepID=A0A1A9UDU1_GLOAU